MEPIRPISRGEPEVRPVQGAQFRVIKREDRRREEEERRERERRERREREGRSARELAALDQQPPPPEEGEGGLIDVRV